jgi:hypothetical protein
MIVAAVFLTSRSKWIVVRCVRRVLRIRAAFESTRSSEDKLARAYDEVVPTVRRALGRDDDAAVREQRADLKRRRIAP